MLSLKFKNYLGVPTIVWYNHKLVLSVKVYPCSTLQYIGNFGILDYSYYVHEVQSLVSKPVFLLTTVCDACNESPWRHGHVSSTTNTCRCSTCKNRECQTVCMRSLCLINQSCQPCPHTYSVSKYVWLLLQGTCQWTCMMSRMMSYSWSEHTVSMHSHTHWCVPCHVGACTDGGQVRHQFELLQVSSTRGTTWLAYWEEGNGETHIHSCWLPS